MQFERIKTEQLTKMLVDKTLRVKELTIDDSSLKNIIFVAEDGNILKLDYESYGGIKFYGPKMVKAFRATITDSRGLLPDMIRDFDVEYERNNFIDNADLDSRFQVALSEFETPAL